MEQSKEHGKIRVKTAISGVFDCTSWSHPVYVGASWDITSHLPRTPETFFTPSHIILYLGVGISLISAIRSLAVFAVQKQAQKNNVFHVCDEVQDIGTAKKSNIQSIAVIGGHNTKDALKKENPDFIVESIDELRSILIS